MLIIKGFFAAAIVVATAASAMPDSSGAVAATERVTYADLDLGSPAGQAALLRRMEAAANRVCDYGGMQTMEDFSKSGQCYRRAIGDGKQQMNQLVAARSAGSVLAASALTISAK